MAANSLSDKLKNALDTVKYAAEGAATEVKAIATGVGPVLKSDAVVSGGGLKAKLDLVKGVARYQFTTARQIVYAASNAPERTAIIDDMGERNYREVLADVQALARALQRKGVKQSDHIGVMCRNSRALIYALGAKGMLGTEIYFLNVASSAQQLAKSIEEHSLDMLFIDEGFTERLPENLGNCDIIIGHADDLQNPQTQNPEWQTFQQVIDAAPSKKEEKLPLFPKKEGIIIMSSGTSGTPKGVYIQEPFIPTPLPSLFTWVPWRKHMMVQMSASMFHAWGWANINLIFAHRATVILRREFDPVEAMEDLEKYRVDAIITSPIFMKEQLREAQLGDYDVSTVEMIISSGHAMSPDLITGIIDKFGPVLANFYGSTEASSCAMARPEELARDPKLAGQAINGVRIKILDNEGNVLPPNTVGRIFCRGALTMKHYTNNRDKMVIERGLLEIGDKGYLTEDGRLYVLGRNDDMIIVGGENVYPRSMEEALEPMPGVRDLYVKGVEDEESFARLAAWVVPDDSEAGRNLTKESIQQWVRDELAEHSVPRDVVFMERLPRNPTGKVMPRMLPDSRENG